MLKLNQLLLTTAAMCLLHLTQAATTSVYQQNTQEESFSGLEIQKIQQSLDQNQETLRGLKNKDIIVFLGDTGAGKSTLINLLAGVELKTDTRGNVVTKESDKGMRIGSGGHSVTKHPQFATVDGVGILCDLPGFEDTDGALIDVINAALIRSILINARSVKSVFVASGPEIDAVRGAAFKRLLQAINMFSNLEVPHHTSLLIVNKMDREQSAHEKVIPILQEIIATQDSKAQGILEKLVHPDKLVVVPKSRYGDKESFLTDAKRDFHQKLGKIRSTLILPEQLNMAITFNSETSGNLVNYFYNGFKDQLKKNESVLDATFAKSFENFQQKLSQEAMFHLLSPLSYRQYQIAIKNFKTTFEREHSLFQQKKLAETTKKEAELAEKKRTEAIEEQKRAQQKANEATQKATELEKEKAAAEQLAAQMKAEAEKIKLDVSRSQKEREDALNKMHLAEQQRQEIQRNMQKQKELAERLRRQQEESLKRMNELEEEQRQATAEAQRTENRLRQQYESAARDKDNELSSLRSDLWDLQQEQQNTYRLRQRISQLEQEQENVSDLRSQIRSLQQELSEKNQEIRQLRARQQHGGSGGAVLVQTPFGFQVMHQNPYGW